MGNNGLPPRCPRVFDRKRMTKLILVRHGHVEGISPERFRGRAELPLTETGHREADATAKRIAASWRPAAIYTSPLGRCVETGAAIGKAAGLTPSVVLRLNEIDFGPDGWVIHSINRTGHLPQTN